MRQLAFRSADVYCQNLNNLKMHTSEILCTNGKKGKQASSWRERERERERVRECEHCGKTDIGVCHKTGSWKNPLISFWDKLGRINFFWELF
jgi:hypothetical protein